MANRLQLSRYRYLVIILTSCVAWLSYPAAPAAETLSARFAAGQIDAQSYLRARYLALGTQRKEQRQCLTPLIQETIALWPQLKPAAKASYSFLYRRPDHPDFVADFGFGVVKGFERPEYIEFMLSEHFVFWYTIDPESDHLVNRADLNLNGEPDYLERLAEIFEESYLREVTQAGFDAPVNDGKIGGDGRLDVYLLNCFDPEDLGIYGFVSPSIFYEPEELSLATIAALNATRYNDSPSYMVIDNDFAYFASASTASTPETANKVTCAHELFHMIQFGYNYLDSVLWNGTRNGSDPYQNNYWWTEASAVAMEEYVYPELDDYHQYLRSNARINALSSPELSINTDQDLYLYSAGLFPIHLLEEHGVELLKASWERSRDVTTEMGTQGGVAIFAAPNSWTNIDLALGARGSSLAKSMASFQIKRIFTGQRFDARLPANRLFADGANYQATLPITELPSMPVIGFAPSDLPLVNGGTYYHITPDPDTEILVEIDLTQTDTLVTWGLNLVLVDDENGEVKVTGNPRFPPGASHLAESIYAEARFEHLYINLFLLATNADDDNTNYLNSNPFGYTISIRPATTEDSGTEDSGTEDSGTEDSGTEDSGTEDSGAEIPIASGTSNSSGSGCFVAQAASQGANAGLLQQLLQLLGQK